MQADQFEIVQAAGLDPALFNPRGYAPACKPPANTILPDLPAILVGTYRSYNTAIRASVRPGVGGPSFPPQRWDAVAFVSQHPGLALEQLTYEERERLRAETLTPTGHDKPVGQKAVIGKTEFAPKIPGAGKPLTQVEPAEAISGIAAGPAPCGGAECFVMQGPEGTQEVHAPNTCPHSAEADRG